LSSGDRWGKEREHKTALKLFFWTSFRFFSFKGFSLDVIHFQMLLKQCEIREDIATSTENLSIHTQNLTFFAFQQLIEFCKTSHSRFDQLST